MVGSIEELCGVTLSLKNKSNAARMLAAWHKHGTLILQYFIEHKSLPGKREVQRLAGGSRGRAGSITRALEWFSAQVLPQLEANPRLIEGAPEFLDALRLAACQTFEVQPQTSILPFSDEVLRTYWVERYRQGDAVERLVTWMCSAHLDQAIQQGMQAIMPLIEVLRRVCQKARPSLTRPP